MRPRLQRALAALMTVSLLGAQAPVNVLAESSTEELAAMEVQAAEETAPETEAPAPETEPPAPETEPPAPETEPPAPETEPPAPETEAPAPETEAPAPVTEAPTEPQTAQATENQQTEAPAPQSESGTEKETEKQKKKEKETETETEKEKTATVFKTEVNGLRVKAQLGKQDALPESAKLVVKAITTQNDEKVYEDALAKVKKLTNQGHRELSSLRLYTVSFADKKGKALDVKGDVELTFTSQDGVDLELGQYLEPGAYTYLIGKTEADEADEAILTQKALVESFTYTGKAGDKIALVGIQNRENDGDKVKAAALKKKFAGFDQDTQKAKEKKDSKKGEKEEKNVLDDADAYALTLSNATSSKDVAVVNLYADAEGKINTEPLNAVLDEQKEAIDVSEHSVVVNIVAYTKDQELTLPQYKVSGKGSDQENAGRVLYNIVTENADGKAETYQGALSVEHAVSGTILAAKATVKLDAEMMGAVYADTLDGDAEQITTVQLGYTDKSDEEAVTEEEIAETEEMTEAVSEAGEVAESITEHEEDSQARRADEQVQAPQIDWTASLGVAAVDEADAEEAKQALNGFTYELVYPGTDGVLGGTDDVVLQNLTTSETPAESTSAANTFDLNLQAADDAANETYKEIKAILENSNAFDGTVVLWVRQAKAADGYVLAEESDAKQVTLNLKDAEQAQTEATEANPDSEASGEDTPAEGDADQEQTVEKKLKLTVAPETLSFINKKFVGLTVPVKVVDTVTKQPLSKDTQISAIAKNADGIETEIGSGIVAGVEETAGEGEPVNNTLTLMLEQDKLREALGLEEGASLDGQKILIKQAPAPEYMPGQASDWSRELTLKAGEDNKLSAVMYADTSEEIDITAVDGITFMDKKVDRNVAFAADSVRTGTNNHIQGITYRLLDETNAILEESLLSKPSAAMKIRTALTDSQLAALQTAETKTITWTLEAMSYPGYDLTSAKTQTITLTLDETGNTAKVKAVPAQVKFEYTQQAQITQDKIKVTKYNYHKNSGIFFTSARTYYAALYDVNGNRVSTIRSITIPKGQSSAYTEFDGLRPGTYTVHEVTQNGEIVPENEASGAEQFYATYAVNGQPGQNVTVNGTVPTGQTYNVTINNNYLNAPAGTSYYAAFRVYKTYFDEKNAAKKVTGNFYFKVYDAKTNKALSSNAYAIALNNAASGSSKRIRMKMTSANAERQLKIVETDSKGNALVSGETYDITYENQTFTLTPSQKDEARITIKNTEVAKKKTETEGPATLTLTKKVTYKGSPIRVNAVYYIGIFDDAGLSKLRYKKAMRFNNASEVSSPLTIHIEKLKDKAVTFYFAEVDAKGKVVSGGQATGYDISQNKKSITLNADNLKDEFVLTNDVLPGTKTEAALTAPGSTFAGDSAALAEAQSLEADANAGAKTTTGDDSPIVPLAIALVLSAGVLSALGIMIRKRRK